MNSMDYLNKIAADNSKRASSASSSFFSKPVLIGLIAAVALTIIIVIFGVINNASSGGEKNLLMRLSLRTDNLTSAINTYNGHVKSSTLRSAGASMSSLLDAVKLNVDAKLEEKDIKMKKAPKKITEPESTIGIELNNSLESGKLNGILDRTYAREFTLQVSLLISLETELRAETKDTDFQTFLDSSVESLSTIYADFANFSEAK